MKVSLALVLVTAMLTGCSSSESDSNDSSSGESNTTQSDSNTDTSTGTSEPEPEPEPEPADDGDSSGENSTNTNDDELTSDDTSDANDSTDTSDSDTSTNDQSDDGSTASTDDDDSSDVTTAACTTTDVGIAFQATNATVVSDPDAAPSELIDGCVDREHSWSGDYGSIVTLDAGAVHQMQGIYIWSTFARMEWIRIESSADGLSWNTDWTMAPTKPVSGPVYFGLDESGSTRYVRITGFGSDLNNWTNITEVRWSLSGYNVSGERVYINRQDDIFTVGTLSLENPALEVIQSVARSASREAIGCGGFPIQVWDATGEMKEFLTVVKKQGSENYLIDFDYRGEDDSGPYSPPSYFWAITAQYDEDHIRDYIAYESANIPSYLHSCRTSDLDLGYGPAAAWRDYLSGYRLPNTAQPDGFR